MTFTARPAAKLNLTLSVGDRRPDGYHELRSIFLRIGLSDRLTVSEAAAGAEDRLVVTGRPGVPVERNTVVHALALLRRRLALRLPALAVELEKLIPVGGGLGGGSSDGAAALELAAAAWGIGVSAGERLELAAQLGSDVPFFATGAPAALVEGRGESVTPLPPVAGLPGVLVVTPPVSVSTAAAFARHDDLGAPRRPASATVSDQLARELQAGLSVEALLSRAPVLRDANDLWPAAVGLVPALGRLRDELEARTGRPWLLSGSGASLFSFYASPAEAADAGRRLVADRSQASRGALLNAVGLEGPDPCWREP